MNVMASLELFGKGKFVSEEYVHLKESRTSELAEKTDKVMGDYLN